MPILGSVRSDSAAYHVYHDHSYFIRHESTNASIDIVHRRKALLVKQIDCSTDNGQTTTSHDCQHNESSTDASLPTVQVLNQLFRQNQEKMSMSPSVCSSSSTIDFAALLRVLLSQQRQTTSTVHTKDTIEISINDTSASTTTTAAS
jgi:hypothetical protein